MAYNFKLPSITGKNADEKVQQLLSYIYKLVGDLNYFANQSADAPKGESTQVGNDANSTNLAIIQKKVRDLQTALNEVKTEIESIPVAPPEVEYLEGVTENIQTQIDAVNEAIAEIEIPTLPEFAKVATSGDYNDLKNLPTIPDIPSEVIYLAGVTSNIQEQLDGHLPLSGGALTGQTSINRTAENKTDPTYQDLVINYNLPNGGTLTERNAPGIGFHISNIDWANLIFDGTFKFVNFNFTAFAPVQASNFIGRLIGNADTATKAIQDGNGNDIAAQLNALKGTVLYEVDPATTNGLYCNGKTVADSVNSASLADSTKKYKRLKIFARFPYGTHIQEFDLATKSQSNNTTYGDRTGGMLVPTADNTNGANNHYFAKLNFCVKETTNGWTFQITEAGWLHMGIPAASTTQYAGTDLTINGTAYAKWNQRHNPSYCVCKIIGYEN